MEVKLRDRSAMVHVVDSNEQVRHVIVASLRSFGFQNINQSSDISCIFDSLAVGQPMPDWIISALLPGDPVTAMHIMEFIIKVPSFHSCRVSLFIEPTEDYCLRNACELGLLSWHTKQGGATKINLHLKMLLQSLAASDWDSTQVSAQYLRSHLAASNSHEEIERLNKTLLMHYPNNARLMLTYAQGLIAAGKKSQGLMVATQARSMDEGIASDVALLLETMANSEIEGVAQVTFATLYNLDNCIIIDSDESVRNHLTEILTELGVLLIQGYSDGESAWTALENMENIPGLVIQEWKIPKLSGAAILQRFRDHPKLRTIPVIVYSSVVSPKDRVLLREIGVSDIIAKPLSKRLLNQTLKSVIEQEFTSDESETLERKIRQELEAQNLTRAAPLLKQYLEISDTPIASKMLLEAEFLYYEGKYSRSKTLAVQALSLGGESLAIISLLGKTLLKLKEYDLARKFLDKAATLSPNNIDRLCLLAEANLHTGNLGAAEVAVGNAKCVDSESRAVKEAEAKIAFTKGDAAETKKILSKLRTGKGLFAFSNNQAVALASQGKFDEALALYHRALDSLPEEDITLAAMVRYNMALSHARLGNASETKRLLELVGKMEESPLSRKIASLRTRAVAAITSGKPLVLQLTGSGDLACTTTGINDAGSINASAEEDEFFPMRDPALPLADGSRAGHLCCHLIFQNLLGLDPQVRDMLARRAKILDAAILKGQKAKP